MKKRRIIKINKILVVKIQNIRQKLRPTLFHTTNTHYYYYCLFKQQFEYSLTRQLLYTIFSVLIVYMCVVAENDLEH